MDEGFWREMSNIIHAFILPVSKKKKNQTKGHKWKKKKGNGNRGNRKKIWVVECMMKNCSKLLTNHSKLILNDQWEKSRNNTACTLEISRDNRKKQKVKT